ncbi:uncharacterized protein LOC124412112 [Diprion similis]|uniref:uncharacterized protein LOC124412112 n=1 Tax=Diprion similis TaxID=362088 RepID=UPI001EF84275|nr:uncharacterized protein LOC124412112 [Diprion similis]
MFEEEDFDLADLDEDFLNDASQKVPRHQSEATSEEKGISFKRFKSDEHVPMDAKSETTELATISTNAVGGNKDRTSLLLERLKQRKNVTSNRNIQRNTVGADSQSLHSEKPNLFNKPLSHRTNIDSKMNSILERLGKANPKSSSSGSSFSSVETSKFTNISHVDTVNSFKSKLPESTVKSPMKFGKPVYNKPVTLIRKFPGPAGLLPDSSCETIPLFIPDSAHLEDSNDSMDNMKTVDNNTSVFSEYCSQNTTNLFSEGAWQLLLSDLTEGFFDDHEISTVKKKLSANSYKNCKIPFLAGVVQRVDFSRPDPLVVLRDCTGTIEGTISKDILVKHPYFVDIGTVLFLGNVPFLTVGTYLKKHHFIVMMKNVVNVYTKKSKTFTTLEMNARLESLKSQSHSLESVGNRAFNSLCSSNSNVGSRLCNERTKTFEKSNPQSCLSNLKNCTNIDDSLNYTAKHKNNNVRQSVETSNFSTVTKQQTNSEDPKNYSSKCGNPPYLDNKENSHTLKDNENSSKCIINKNVKFAFESDDFDDEFSASFLDIDDELVSQVITNTDSVTHKEIETKSTISSKQHTVKSKTNPVQCVAVQSSVNSIKENESVPKVFSSCINNVEKSVTNGEKVTVVSRVNGQSNTSKVSETKLKLAMFRSNDDLTPPDYENINTTLAHNENVKKLEDKNNERDKPTSTSNFMSHIADDSDEEFLSQLDVESIVSRYNKLSNVN